jgi:hypothetical protein
MTSVKATTPSQFRPSKFQLSALKRNIISRHCRSLDGSTCRGNKLVCSAYICFLATKSLNGLVFKSFDLPLVSLRKILLPFSLKSVLLSSGNALKWLLSSNLNFKLSKNVERRALTIFAKFLNKNTLNKSIWKKKWKFSKIVVSEPRANPIKKFSSSVL